MGSRFIKMTAFFKMAPDAGWLAFILLNEGQWPSFILNSDIVHALSSCKLLRQAYVTHTIIGDGGPIDYMETKRACGPIKKKHLHLTLSSFPDQENHIGFCPDHVSSSTWIYWTLKFPKGTIYVGPS